ncbi:porin family protein [Cytophagaceae bacterium ABcell3]|nr:porin family protein [Cytophagaceae bacterium ABcell3]
MQIGIVAGGSFSTARGDLGRYLDIKGVPGFLSGVQIEKSLNDKFSIQPELLISYRGYRFASDMYNTYTRNSLLYIDIPVLLKYKFVENLSFEGGIQLSHLLTTNLNINEQNLYNFSLVAGVSSMLNEKIEVGARYVFGLTNLYSQIDISHYYTDFPMRSREISTSPERFLMFFVRYNFLSIE